MTFFNKLLALSHAFIQSRLSQRGLGLSNLFFCLIISSLSNFEIILRSSTSSTLSVGNQSQGSTKPTNSKFGGPLSVATNST